MKARLRLYLAFGGAICAATSGQVVGVASGQVDNSRQPLPASPSHVGLPIHTSQTQNQAHQYGPGTNIQTTEVLSSLAQLKWHLRETLGRLDSYIGATESTAAIGAIGGIGANSVSLSGNNLSSHSGTNLSNRAGGNLSANISSPAGLAPNEGLAPGQPVVVTPPVPGSPGSNTAAIRSPSTNLVAIQQQISSLIAQLDALGSSLPGGVIDTLGAATTNSMPAERGQQLTPTGRTPPANGRPQPPRNLRLVR